MKTNDKQFDDVTCGMTRRSGRRKLLSGVAASGFAAALGRVTGKEAGAKSGGVCGKGCGTLCEDKTAAIVCSPQNENCFCLRSTSGQVHCADATTASGQLGDPDECRVDADCGPGMICVHCGGPCCPADKEFNFCIAKCADATPEHLVGRGDLVTDALARLRVSER